MGLRKVRSATPWHLRSKTKTVEIVWSETSASQRHNPTPTFVFLSSTVGRPKLVECLKGNSHSIAHINFLRRPISAFLGRNLPYVRESDFSSKCDGRNPYQDVWVC